MIRAQSPRLIRRLPAGRLQSSRHNRAGPSISWSPATKRQKLTDRFAVVKTAAISQPQMNADRHRLAPPRSFELAGRVTPLRAATSHHPDGALGVTRPAVLLCPCGCGETIHLSLATDATSSWRLQTHRGNRVTLLPSVWRTVGCKSHFIIYRGHIFWCSDDYEDWNASDGW
jgi:uncharacterized protein DUF6527